MKYFLLLLLALAVFTNNFSQTPLTEKEQQANAEKQAALLSEKLPAILSIPPIILTTAG